MEISGYLFLGRYPLFFSSNLAFEILQPPFPIVFQLVSVLALSDPFCPALSVVVLADEPSDSALPDAKSLNEPDPAVRVLCYQLSKEVVVAFRVHRLL